MTLYGISNGKGTAANNMIYRINPANGDLSNLAQVTLPGFTVFKSQALTARPSDGALFAVVQTTNTFGGGRRLVIVNPATGVSTDVGALSQDISSLSFRANGTLYAVSGDGAAIPETLFTCSTVNATLTLVICSRQRGRRRDDRLPWQRLALSLIRKRNG